MHVKKAASAIEVSLDNVSDRESRIQVPVENLSSFGIDIER